MALVWPVLAEQVLAMLVGLSDTLLAGRYLSHSHLAAMTVMAYVLWLLGSLASFVSIGATAMTARFIGAGDLLLASRVVNQSYVLAGAMATVLTIVGLLCGDLLIDGFHILQLEGEAAELATRYLRTMLPVLPALMLESVGIACLRGAGDMKSGLMTMLLVNVTNVAVAWSLMVGWGPLPALGWDGLAIGTATGHLVGGLIPLALLSRGRAGLRLHWNLLQPDRELMRRILRIGVPGGCDVLAIIACQFAFLSIVNRLGVLALAAHGVALRIESLAYLPGYAFEVAAATLAGQHLGARDQVQATRSVQAAALVGVGLLSAIGLVFYFGADHLVRLFLRPDELAVAAQAAPLLRIIALVMPPFALMMILTGALRGAGDTRATLVFTFVGVLGVRLPTAYWFALNLGWGVEGAWYAMATDLVVRCLLVTWRFQHGGWKRIAV